MLFRGGQLLLLDETGVPGENNQLLLRKLAIQVNFSRVHMPRVEFELATSVLTG